MFQIENTPIQGLKIVNAAEFPDSRGMFCERFHSEKFGKLALPSQFVQVNHSVSNPHVLRGLHIQLEPMQGKLVSCLVGEVLDVVVDLRLSSHTFGRHFSVKLDGQSKRALWVPPGFAHGFLVTSQVEAHVLYMVTELYNPKTEQTLCFNDPELNIDWGDSAPILSDKDKIGLSLSELKHLLNEV